VPSVVFNHNKNSEAGLQKYTVLATTQDMLSLLHDTVVEFDPSAQPMAAFPAGEQAKKIAH